MATPYAAAVLKALGGKSAAGRANMPEMREDALQMALARHLELLAMPGVAWWHTPNGGGRSRGEAGRFKAMGVKAGIPDILLLHQGRLYGLELKTEAGRLSPEQQIIQRALGGAGATVAVAYGLDAALAQLRGWGLMRGASGTTAPIGATTTETKGTAA